jgi:hypothetical protein
MGITTKNDIQTIELGDGNTVIGDWYSNDGSKMVGVCFTEAVRRDLPVGEDHSELTGYVGKDLNPFFQIITSNPASIQVLIDKLELAKDALESKD